MGITKTDGFDDNVTMMADVLKVLGHPARLSIIMYLAQKNSCVCGDIVEELPLAQSTVSRHLSELKRVGLIKGTISGSNICYCIEAEKWKQVEAYFTQTSIQVCKTQNCC